MPLTRISLKKGKSIEYKSSLTKGIYQAMVATFNVPENDVFMLIHEHESEDFVFGKDYLNVNRTDDLIIIQITANNTRTVEQKKALYAKIVDILNESIHIRKEDVFINLVEVGKENWSFGNGIAQYA